MDFPDLDAPHKIMDTAPFVGSSRSNFFDGKDISIVGMSFLPPVSLPPLPLPSRPGPSAMGKSSFLPPAVPSNSQAFLPPVAPSASAVDPNKTSHLTPTVPTEKKKGGRPSKADKLKAARASASESIAELLESEPSKKDVIKYFEERIESLRS